MIFITLVYRYSPECRKSMVAVTQCSPHERVAGSVACAVIAAMQGTNYSMFMMLKETVDGHESGGDSFCKETNDNERT